jgi:cyclase
MAIVRVIPCLLLKDRGLVKTIRFRKPTYLGDPINIVRIFNDKEVDELIFLDITATQKRKSPPIDFIKNIASECFMPLCYGGGITSIEQIKEIFSLGVEKVSLNAEALNRPDLIRVAAEIFGSQSIVVSIDVKKTFLGDYKVFTLSGRKNSGLHPVEWAKQAENLGAGELLINNIDRDGMMNGYDIKLMRMVTKEVNIPVVACGGARSVDDLVEVVKEGGASAAAVGSMFVFNGPQRAVLINYLSREILDGAFDGHERRSN